MKTCTHCSQELPLDAFHKHKGFQDGHRNICKVCANEVSRKYYRDNRDKHLESCRSWKTRNKTRFENYQKQYKQTTQAQNNQRKWAMSHPIRVKAQKTLNYAVFKGELEKSSCCQVCGDSAPRIEAHHYDYNKPLEVIWVCTSCHGWIHRKHSQLAAVNA